LAARQAKTQE
jgi:aspartyl-tRNA synthetase